MAYRKGLVLQFGLVTCIVSIDGAVEKADSLKSVCLGIAGSPSHVPTPITQQKVCKTCGPVQHTDLHKAREVGAGQFQVVDQQEVATVRDTVLGASKKMLKLDVVDNEAFSSQTVQGEGVYFIAPDGPAQIGAYSLLYDAVKRHPDKAFITQYTPSSALGFWQLRAFNDQLVIERRSWPEDVREGTFHDVVEPDAALQTQMDQVVATMVIPFEAEDYRNTFAASLEALLASKATQDGEIVERAKTEKSVATAGVVDLSSQLSAMLGNAAPATKPKAKPRKSA